MRWAFFSRSADRTPLRRRATSLALTVAAHLLILLLLLRLAPSETPPPPRQARPPAIFALLPERQPDRTAAPHAAPKATHHAAAAAPRRVAATPPRPHTPVPPTTPTTPSPLMPMSLADSDIAKITAPPAASADSGTGKDSGTAYGPGAGPGGERLYDVAWYREPTRAELAYYLPPGGAPPGQADIACRMIAGYHVENCRELNESPAGSGLARALRQAAWQFRVLPPRIGGKVVLGGWVRIHFVFTDRGEK